MTEGIFDSNEVNRLTLALKNDEIVPYFQPIVGSKGELCGVEVLARWPSGHNYAILNVSSSRWRKLVVK